MENLPKTKKIKTSSWFYSRSYWWLGGRIKQNDDWGFDGYKGTNLGYDMMCESVNSDQEEKQGDVLNGNLIINQYPGTPQTRIVASWRPIEC